VIHFPADKELYDEIKDDEMANIRSLQSDIMFLGKLKEQAKQVCPEDWEMEELLSLLIHEDGQLIISSKETWHEAKVASDRLEKLRRSGQDS